LKAWLPETKNKLPYGPIFSVGVGGFVVNDKNEVLVIKEKTGPAVKIWKVPGAITFVLTKF
jgi:hypothetical protein